MLRVLIRDIFSRSKMVGRVRITVAEMPPKDNEERSERGDCNVLISIIAPDYMETRVLLGPQTTVALQDILNEWKPKEITS